jgi:hypothetical protein
VEKERKGRGSGSGSPSGSKNVTTLNRTEQNRHYQFFYGRRIRNVGIFEVGR